MLVTAEIRNRSPMMTRQRAAWTATVSVAQAHLVDFPSFSFLVSSAQLYLNKTLLVTFKFQDGGRAIPSAHLSRASSNCWTRAATKPTPYTWREPDRTHDSTLITSIPRTPSIGFRSSHYTRSAEKMLLENRWNHNLKRVQVQVQIKSR